ncbi:MAG TPA: nucleotide sugar dehydrogenase [Burkholderiales bacterium]|nr:nucleotide sugar dehydrogenase [Burkholderiales bacterium]
MSGIQVGFAGMTHLGVNSAAAALARDFGVVGYDADRDVIERLRRGDPHVVEPGLPEVLRRHASRANYTANIADLSRCDLVYIASDVPTDDSGASDLAGIRRLVEAVAGALARGTVVVVLCQVPPGFTRALTLPRERLFYQVETLVFGEAIERAMHPERIILGCANPSAKLPAALGEFLSAFGCPILPMRYESAELAKIAINCCLVSSISAANTLAELCERLGAAWSEIAPALKLDRRIGQHAYLAPGLGIAGGNLERDLATICELADAHGADARVVRAWIANSRHRRDWALQTLHGAVLSRLEDPVIAVLGLAYKQNTHSTKNSPSLALLAHLAPFRVRVFDPVVPATAITNPRCHAASSELDACEGADALAIMTPWAQFGALDPAQVARRLRGSLVLDPYAVLKEAACRAAGLEYHTLGMKY